MGQKILQEILKHKIISIVRGVHSSQILDVVKALQEGGVCCVEVTFHPANAEVSKDTLRSIEAIRNHFEGNVFVGAGTVLTAQNVDDAVAAGAEFMISPTVSQKVIERTKQLNKVSMPGAYTPTEAQQAYEYGADIIKLFPSDALGPSFFKSIKAPLSHLKFAAVGGVNVDNIGEFLKVGVDAFGIGSNLVNAKLAQDKNWDAIRKSAAAYTQAIQNFK